MLGKFFAAWCFSGVALCLTFPMWITVNYLGDPDNTVIMTGYLGSLLLAGGFLAIGSCISALSKNQVIAFVISIVLCFLFILSGFPLVLDFFQGWAPQLLVELVSSLSFLTHFESVKKGVIDLRDLIYYLVFIAFWLYANVVVINTRKGGLSGAMFIQYKKLASGSGILVAALLTTSLIIISNNLFTGVRLDLTGKQNSLPCRRAPSTSSPRWKNRCHWIFTSPARPWLDYPQLINYANRVRDLLEEYAAKSDGMIRLTIIEPEPFSEAEDQAVAGGLNGIAVNAAGDHGYLGLIGTNSTDDEAVIPFFQINREAALEYDLTKLIYNLVNPKKRVVGVVSALPLFGNPARGMGAARRPWAIISAMREFFDVRELSNSPDLINDEVDVLMVAHPKDLSEKTLFAIDQYILKGGNALLFVDPLAEGDNARPDPANPYVMPDMASNLNPLLDAWGIRLDESKVAADVNLAMRVADARGARDARR